MADPAVQPAPVALPDRRFDRRLAEILAHATDVFYEKGYEGASMRDLSRASGTSLAGLYYYFESKEKLLFLIQKSTFETVLDRVEKRLHDIEDPEERLRAFVANHLEYFLANRKGMKVLSHEGESLGGEMGAQIREVKRRYYQTCRDLLDAIAAARGVSFNSRVAALSLFGMMNWIYTWHRAGTDPGADVLGQQMADLILHGIPGARSVRKDSVRREVDSKVHSPKRDSKQRATARKTAK